LAFRLTEPVPQISNTRLANTIVEGGALVKQDGSYWRERRQGDVLASGDVSEFSADVDSEKLVLPRERRLGPCRGPATLDRIMASHSPSGREWTTTRSA